MKKIYLIIISTIIFITCFNFNKIYAYETEDVNSPSSIGTWNDEQVIKDKLEESENAISNYSSDFRSYEGTGEQTKVYAAKMPVTKTKDGHYFVYKGDSYLDLDMYEDYLSKWYTEEEQTLDLWFEIGIQVDYTDGGMYWPYIWKVIYDTNGDYNPDEEAWLETRKTKEVVDEAGETIKEGIDAVKETVGNAKDLGGFVYDVVTGKFEKMLKDLANNAMIFLLNLLRGLADAFQIIADFIAPIDGKDITKITFTRDILKTDAAKNSYTKVRDYKKDGKASWQIQAINVEGEEFDEETPIPVITVDLYTLASASIDAMDTNFLVTKDSKTHTAWMKIRNFVATVTKITLYIASAILITSLIWYGLHIVVGSITPEQRRENMEGINNFAKSVLLLVGTVVIMAVSNYASDMFFEKIRAKDNIEQPIRVNVENAKYSFSTNITGYVRYMSEIDNKDLVGEKALYVFAYFILTEANVIAALLVIIRMFVMIILSIIGPIIAALHVFELDDGLPIRYRDWVNWYVSLALVRLIFVLAYRIVMEIAFR